MLCEPSPSPSCLPAGHGQTRSDGLVRGKSCASPRSVTPDPYPSSLACGGVLGCSLPVFRPAHRGWCAVLAGLVLVHAAGCARPAESLLLAMSATKTSADGTMFWMSGEHDATVLSLDEARHLAANPLGVAVRRLTALDVAAATALAACPGSLQFDALTSISPPAARSLSRHRGVLRLDSLTHLSPDAAVGLAGHDGRLSLAGLRSLDLPTARALARHRGVLVLNGLTTLDAAAAHALAAHEGPVCVNGLDGIDGETAAILGTVSQGAIFFTRKGG